MRARIAGAFILAGMLLTGLAPTVAASPSCTAQFAAVAARAVQPFGQVIVAPEAQNPTFGGPNLGQEVKVLLATADKNACPFG